MRDKRKYLLAKAMIDTGRMCTVSVNDYYSGEQIINCRTRVRIQALRAASLSIPRFGIAVYDIREKRYRVIDTEKINWIKASGQQTYFDY